jgi:hypothetical protein
MYSAHRAAHECCRVICTASPQVMQWAPFPRRRLRRATVEYPKVPKTPSKRHDVCWELTAMRASHSALFATPCHHAVRLDTQPRGLQMTQRCARVLSVNPRLEAAQGRHSSEASRQYISMHLHTDMGSPTPVYVNKPNNSRSPLPKRRFSGFSIELSPWTLSSMYVATKLAQP